MRVTKEKVSEGQRKKTESKEDVNDKNASLDKKM